MTKRAGILCLFCLLMFSFNADAQTLQAYFKYCRFNSPQNQKYIETYLSIIGNSLTYKKNNNNLLQGEIEITIILKQGEKIKDYKKYTLHSPEYKEDSLINYKNFVDLQRLSADNGKYELEFQIIDKNNAASKIISYSEPLEIIFPDSTIAISDIELIESHSKSQNRNAFSKAGFDMVPYVADFYPKSLNRLTFYTEIYNTKQKLGEDEKFLINYYLEDFEQEKQLNDYSSFSKRSATDIGILFNEFNIEKLPTGNYNFVVELRNKNNELLDVKKQFIQRSNQGVDIKTEDLAGINLENSFVSQYGNNDSLSEMIKCLNPIASRLEMVFIENQLKNSDAKLKQQFMYNFWQNRDALNPEKAWQNYLVEVNKVEKAYSTRLKRGYMTDRGRIHLKYGIPNTINANYNEPDSYPYEIWHYYKIGKFSNKKFVFYNSDLISNDFALLHSDLFGETNNPQWKVILHSRSTQVNDLDQNELPNKNYGNNADDLFKSPR